MISVLELGSPITYNILSLLTLFPLYLLSSHSSFLLLLNPHNSRFVGLSVFLSEGMEENGISEGRFWRRRDHTKGQYLFDLNGYGTSGFICF